MGNQLESGKTDSFNHNIPQENSLPLRVQPQSGVEEVKNVLPPRQVDLSRPAQPQVQAPPANSGSHPHIAKVLNVPGQGFQFESTTQTLSQMISERLPNKHFTESDMFALVKGLISALNFLHQANTTHGGIDCSTIYFEEVSGCFKLANHSMLFGINSGLNVSVSGGKKSFLAPEQLLVYHGNEPLTGEHKYYKADVFTLGLAFLEAATLEPSNDCYNWQNGFIIADVVKARIEKASTIYSPLLGHLIDMMLEFDHNTRPNSRDLYVQVVENSNQYAPQMRIPQHQPQYQQNIQNPPQNQIPLQPQTPQQLQAPHSHQQMMMQQQVPQQLQVQPHTHQQMMMEQNYQNQSVPQSQNSMAHINHQRQNIPGPQIQPPQQQPFGNPQMNFQPQSHQSMNGSYIHQNQVSNSMVQAIPQPHLHPQPQQYQFVSNQVQPQMQMPDPHQQEAFFNNQQPPSLKGSYLNCNQPQPMQHQQPQYGIPQEQFYEMQATPQPQRVLQMNPNHYEQPQVQSFQPQVQPMQMMFNERQSYGMENLVSPVKVRLSQVQAENQNYQMAYEYGKPMPQQPQMDIPQLQGIHPVVSQLIQPDQLGFNPHPGMNVNPENQMRPALMQVNMNKQLPQRQNQMFFQENEKQREVMSSLDQRMEEVLARTAAVTQMINNQNLAA